MGSHFDKYSDEELVAKLFAYRDEQEGIRLAGTEDNRQMMKAWYKNVIKNRQSDRRHLGSAPGIR